MPSTDRATKRQRAAVVCRLCLSCKTRCEDVTELGCKRCRDKKRLCSFIENGESTGNSTARRPVESATDNRTVLPRDSSSSTSRQGRRNSRQEQTARQSVIEERHNFVPQVDSVPPSVAWHTSASTSPFTSNHNAQPILSPLPSNDSTNQYPHFDNVLDSSEFDERLCTASNAREFPDVIKLGLMTSDQVDHAFFIFQRRLTALLYLPPFCELAVDNNILQHPFLTLATLCYTPFTQTVDFAPLIDRSVRLVMSGCVSSEVVTALYLIAMAPVLPSAAQTPHMTSGWFLELAYSAGRRLGLEARSKKALEDPERLCEPWFAATLELVLLWENIKARHNIVSLMYTLTDELLPSWANRLPSNHPREAYRLAIGQLRLLLSLVEAAAGTHQCLVREEYEGTASGPVADMDHKAWRTMMSKLDDLSHDPCMTDLIRSEIGCLPQMLAMRYGALLRKFPTPLAEERLSAMIVVVGTVLFPSLKHLAVSCENLSEDQLPHLPSYLTTAYVFGMLHIRRVMSFVPPLTDGSDGWERQHHPALDLVEKLEDRLSRAGPFQALILSKGKQALAKQGRLHGKARNAQDMDANDPFSGLALWDLDLSMIDWEALGIPPMDN